MLDVNDSPPRFVQKEWHLEIDENDSLLSSAFASSTSNYSASIDGSFNRNHFKPHVLLKLMVNDGDLPETNRFLFKIIEQQNSLRPILKMNNWNSLYNEKPNQLNRSSAFITASTSSLLKFNDSNQFSIEQDFNETGLSLKLNENPNSAGTRTVALLLNTNALDYENPMQRFIMLKIAVTDLGTWNSSYFNENNIDNNNNQDTNLDRAKAANGANDDYSDSYVHNYFGASSSHIDICYIYIKIRDTNDNQPKFAQNFINITLAENVPIGTVIAKFKAIDPDQNGQSLVQYSLDTNTNQRRYFSIDQRNGFVKLNRQLDRETTSLHIVKIIASDIGDRSDYGQHYANLVHIADEANDYGTISLSSTATLVVNVDDINDNAPFLINTSLPAIVENSPPGKLGELFAFDRDDYTKGLSI